MLICNRLPANRQPYEASASNDSADAHIPSASSTFYSFDAKKEKAKTRDATVGYSLHICLADG